VFPFILALIFQAVTNAAGQNTGDRRQAPRPPAPSTRSAAASPSDLEGVWSYATLTPFERPAELTGVEFFTDAQAAEFEAQTIGRNDRDRRDGGAATDAARGVAEFWFDRGEHVASFDGKRRTSWVIDPPDGKVPPLTPEARARMAARNADQRDHPADGPENRSLQERCLAFNAGPPIGLGPYNNFLQIFQTRDSVVIYTEMIHDARIVWTDGRPHAPSVLRRWLGDSRGRWEGNTLVVDTTNFTDKNPFRGSGENLHLTERFTRTDANTLLYEFTVEIRRRSRIPGQRSCRCRRATSRSSSTRATRGTTRCPTSCGAPGFRKSRAKSTSDGAHTVAIRTRH